MQPGADELLDMMLARALRDARTDSDYQYDERCAPRVRAFGEGVSNNPLTTLLRPLRGQLLLAVVASALSGLASMALVALINRALSAELSEVATIGVSFALACVVSLSCRWLAEERFARLGQITLARLRLSVSRRIMALSYREFEQIGGARCNAALTEDASSVAHACSILPGVTINAFLVLAALTYMAWLSPPVFACVVGVLLVGVFAYVAVESMALRTLRQARNQEDEVFRAFGGLLEGGKELRLHAARRRAFLEHAVGAAIESVRALRSRGLSISIAASSVGAFLFFVVIGVVTFALSHVWKLDRSVISGYALVFLYLMFPLESLLGALPMLERGRVALERIEGLARPLDRSAADQDAVEPPPSGAFTRLRLEGVTHRYRHEGDGEFVLGPIDLELAPGEVTFLIGGNGSGKTTLAKLLVGLYAPEQGRVLIDGVEVTEATREAHRGRCSAVFSDFHLFDALWGLDGEAVASAASAGLEQLGLSHRVRLEAGRFSTTSLSQGQRKRLAFLVASLEERPLVVFDEWAADQDPANKDFFYRELVPALAARGKSVVVVTHDDRYFELGDRCLRLEFGQLVDEQPVAASTRAAPDREASASARANAPKGWVLVGN
jgi:putative pyoverdin transport system ATP-binding/permease protein